MKTIYKLLSIVACLSLLSCGDDFLDKNDPTRLNTATFYQTETQMDQAVGALYGGLQDITSINGSMGSLFQITLRCAIMLKTGDKALR